LIRQIKAEGGSLSSLGTPGRGGLGGAASGAGGWHLPAMGYGGGQQIKHYSTAAARAEMSLGQMQKLERSVWRKYSDDPDVYRERNRINRLHRAEMTRMRSLWAGHPEFEQAGRFWRGIGQRVAQPAEMMNWVGGARREARSALKLTRGAKHLASALARGGVGGMVAAGASMLKGASAFARVAGPVGMGAAVILETVNTWNSTTEYWKDYYSDERQAKLGRTALRATALASARGRVVGTYEQQRRMQFAQYQANQVAKATGVDEKFANIAMAQAIARSEYVGGNWADIKQMAMAAAKSSKPGEAAAAELAKIRGWEPKKIQRAPVEYKRPAKGGN